VRRTHPGVLHHRLALPAVVRLPPRCDQRHVVSVVRRHRAAVLSGEHLQRQ
jgi:hypothetical protein